MHEGKDKSHGTRAEVLATGKAAPMTAEERKVILASSARNNFRMV